MSVIPLPIYLAAALLIAWRWVRAVRVMNEAIDHAERSSS